jgi:His-Xaa-Ser system protein HxsD
MKKIKLNAKIYDKESILYVLNLYDTTYEIDFKNNYYIITFEEDLDKEDISLLRKKINSTQLRKDIANSNKKIREYIIATALGFPEE